MELSDLLRALSKKRAPWLAAARILLRAAGFETHRGYEETIAAALEEAEDAVRLSRLERLLKEYAVAGEKLIRVVALSRQEREIVRQWIAGKRMSVNPLTACFPGVTAENTLKTLVGQAPVSVGSLALEDGSAALFTAVRAHLDRVSIQPNQLRPGENDGYEKIYALKRVFHQVYDSIWLPAGSDYVYLISDLPPEMPSGFASESQEALEFQLRRLLGRTIKPENLWSAIGKLYASEQGRLVDYGFVNNTDAVKRHTGRRGGGDLRKDVYDKAGAAAVGDDLQLFLIAIAWSRGKEYPPKAQPELILPGTASDLYMPGSKLTHCIVRNCLGSKDLAFVMSQLMAHV